MKEFKIKYNQLLFLYAYLRQIDLSLDRSRWNSWNEFQNYFESRLQPFSVIEYLKMSFQLPETDFDQFVFFLEKKTFSEKLKSNFAKSLFLKQNEILYCCKLLSLFNKYLKSDVEEYNLEIEKLRIDIAEYYSKLLELMISKKDLKKLMKIEHYKQSDTIEVVSLKEFLPDVFKDEEDFESFIK